MTVNERIAELRTAGRTDEADRLSAKVNAGDIDVDAYGNPYVIGTDDEGDREWYVVDDD